MALNLQEKKKTYVVAEGIRRTLSRRLVPLAIVVASLFVTGLMFGPQLARADDSRPSALPLSPEWIELIARKEQARKTDPRAANTNSERAPNPAGPDTPVRALSRQVITSKADVRQRFAERSASVERYIAALVASGAPAAAERQRAELEAELQQIEALPEGDFSIEVPALETGAHSITLSMQAYNSAFVATDPMSFTFYNVGSSWDVWYDLQNLTQPLWSNEISCVSSLQAYTWDAAHGGTDGWEWQDYHLVRGPCPGPRDHMRLFDRGYTDTHGQYGRWSFSEPHQDRFPDHCVDDWESPQSRLHQSFLADATGAPLPFVGAVYMVNWGNAGTYGCATANEWGWYIELIQ